MTRQWTGRDILVALILTFGVVIGVNVYFIVQAERTWPGQDVAHPYLQGLDYNQTLDDRAKQTKLGWSATIDGARANNGAAIITVTVKDKAGKPVTDEALMGLLRHPTDEVRDHPIVLKEETDGVYVGQVKHVATGQWDVIVIRKSRKEAPFEAERRIWLP